MSHDRSDAADWRRSAARRLFVMREMIREECAPHNQWPIWIHGLELGFPGDDSVAPGPPANDVVFTIRH